MQPIPFNITPDAVTVVVDGQPKTHRKGTAIYATLVPALLAEDWENAAEALKPNGPLATFLASHGLIEFSVKDNMLHYGDEPVHENMRTRIERMLVAGEDPHRLLRFYERLQENPSQRSVTQLWDFLQHLGIAIEPDGTFLAYKGVRRDLKDVHSGTVDNTPGVINEMPRNKISDDPNTPCHYGYHVGALEYAGDFGGSDNVVVICRVDPKDVVCVPYDYSSQKMRVCKYEVVGFHNGEKLGDSETVEEAPVADKNEPKTEEPKTAAADVRCWNCKGPALEEDRCFGCDQVICDQCERTGACGDHDPEDHLDEDSPEAGSRADVEREPVASVFSTDTVQGVVDTEPEPTKPKTVPAKRLAKLTPAQLMKESIETLRAYASFVKVVGASHLKGGKTALVPLIVKARKKLGHKGKRGKKSR